MYSTMEVIFPIHLVGKKWNVSCLDEGDRGVEGGGEGGQGGLQPGHQQHQRCCQQLRRSGRGAGGERLLSNGGR